MDSASLFCLRSCLKSGDNREYYELLELKSKRPTEDEIKRGYKKASLANHPDKLSQRGIEVTDAHREKFHKIKEAYEVLSDPKRKKIYDQLGETGLKFFENPQNVSPKELIKNFQVLRMHPIHLIFICFMSG
jgi:DnaJ-class molecular chaperone